MGALPLAPQLSVGGLSLTFTFDDLPTLDTVRRLLISHTSPGPTPITTGLGKMDLRFGRLMVSDPIPPSTNLIPTSTWFGTAKNWHRFTIRFGASDCDFYLDGRVKALALPLPAFGVGLAPTVLMVKGSAFADDPAALDDLQVSLNPPLPDFPDANHDGLPDSWEGLMGLDTTVDSRSTLLNGSTALAAYQAYATRNPPGTPLGKIDTDGDGMPDAYEQDYSAFLDYLNPADAAPDFDGDGKSNLEEFTLGTTPISPPLYSTEAIPFPSTGMPEDEAQVNMNLLASSPDGHAVVEARYRGKFLGAFIFDPSAHTSEWLDLPTVAWVYVAGVNNAGQVIGSHPYPNGCSSMAFLTKARRSDGVSTRIYAFTPTSVANPSWLDLLSINAAGEVLGTCYAPINWDRVDFLYNPASPSNPASVVLNLGQTYFSGRLTDSGDLAVQKVVGGTYRLKRYKVRSQSFADLLSNGAGWACEMSSNQVGDFIGLYQPTANSAYAACLWKKFTGQLITLGVLNASFGTASASAVNNAGTVVGALPMGDGSYQACVWPSTQGDAPPPTLLGLPSANFSVANFINNNAFPIIVGTSYIHGEAKEFISRFGLTQPLLECAARRANFSLEHVQRLTDGGGILVSGHSEKAHCLYWLIQPQTPTGMASRTNGSALTTAPESTSILTPSKTAMRILITWWADSPPRTVSTIIKNFSSEQTRRTGIPMVMVWTTGGRFITTSIRSILPMETRIQTMTLLRTKKSLPTIRTPEAG